MEVSLASKNTKRILLDDNKIRIKSAASSLRREMKIDIWVESASNLSKDKVLPALRGKMLKTNLSSKERFSLSAPIPYPLIPKP